MKFYWFRFDALPVTVHLKEDMRFHWQQIRGVQIGPWFFGAIRGSLTPPPSRMKAAAGDEQ